MISRSHRVRVATVAFAAALVCATSFNAAAAPTTSSATTAAASRVTFDRQCFTIDGHDTLIYSAAFHYFRCPKELWRDRFRKLKEAGFNTVETYVAWDWHERIPPKDVDDVSQLDMSELDEWLTMATQEFGFYVMIRPGPYICAEWDGGGYPQWLTLKRPANFKGQWFRGDDPEYLKWCRHWYAAVAKTTLPHLITHKPAGAKGVILWQLENEYNYAGKPETQMLGQLLALGKMSREFGIDVPLFTCVTHNPTLKEDPWLAANVIDSMNTYPGFNIDGMHGGMNYLVDYQPQKPRMITELQGGWFSTLGGKLSDQQGHTAAQIQQLTLFAWANGFTSTNYYMGFGGTNLGDWAASNLMTSYDYNAPLREAGGVGDRYLAVKGMGAFVAEYGPKLARATELPIEVAECTSDDVKVNVRVAKDGTEFVFVRTEFRDGPQRGTIRFTPDGNRDETPSPTVVYYDLPPFGASVCVVAPANQTPASVWYPKPQDPPRRPTTLPAAIDVAEVRSKYDSVPAAPEAWRDYPHGSSVEDVGIFDRRTTIYRATAKLSAALNQSGDHPVIKVALHDRDDATVLMNGHRLRPTSHEGGEATFAIDPVPAHDKPDATTDFVIVYENGGRPNGGAGMERRNGLGEVWIADASSTPKVLTTWKQHAVDDPKDRSLVGVDVDDSAWAPKHNTRDEDGGLAINASACYRCSVDVTADEIAKGRELLLPRIDDRGYVFVNGQPVGESTNWQEPFVRDVTTQLKPGRNVIAVVVQNLQSGGGLTRNGMLQPRGHRDPTALGLDWKIALGTTGMSGDWSAAVVDEDQWNSSALRDLRTRATPNDDDAPLTWYRIPFTLPPDDPHAWIPWKARLNISGNAFLYLNGHPLGRYWNAGPQRDFFLPGCWLKPGGANVLTAAVRGIEHAGELRSATIMPYDDQAEVR